MPDKIHLRDASTGKEYKLLGPFSIVNEDGTKTVLTTLDQFEQNLTAAALSLRGDKSVPLNCDGTYTFAMDFTDTFAEPSVSIPISKETHDAILGLPLAPAEQSLLNQWRDLLIRGSNNE